MTYWCGNGAANHHLRVALVENADHVVEAALAYWSLYPDQPTVVVSVLGETKCERFTKGDSSGTDEE